MQKEESDSPSQTHGVKGVIFDLDGTLIDSFEAIREGFNTTLPLYGLDPLSLDETKSVVGSPLKDTLAEMVGEENAEEATVIFRKRYKEVYLEKTLPMPYADEIIKKLFGKGLKLGVATNKHGGFSRKIIEHLGWNELIGSVVGEGDTAKSKPEPDMIFQNLENLSIGNKETLFIGDSPVDLKTGENASVKTIAVPTGHHSKEMLLKAGATVVIEDLSCLEEAVF
ncbi:MAG: HAD family hydrolase [Deltaproteobacteria bacterium]|nr:HAD family hydrolase [Deltaproteobacteria bacterium]